MASLNTNHDDLTLASPDDRAATVASLSFDPLVLWWSLGRNDLLINVLSRIAIDDIKNASQVSEEWNKIIADTLGHYITLLVRKDSVARTAAEIRGLSLSDPTATSGAVLTSRTSKERIKTNKIIEIFRLVSSNAYKAVKNRPVNSDVLKNCDPIIRIEIPQRITRSVIDPTNNILVTFGAAGAHVYKLDPAMSNVSHVDIYCTRFWFEAEPRKYILSIAVSEGSLAVLSFSLDRMTLLTLYSVEDGSLQQETVVQAAGIVRPRKAEVSMTKSYILVTIVFQTPPSYQPLRKVLVFSRSLEDTPTERKFRGEATLSLHHDRVLLHYENAKSPAASFEEDDEDQEEEAEEEAPSLLIYQVDSERQLSLVYWASLQKLIQDQVGIEEFSWHDRFCSATIIGDKVMTVVKGYGGWEDTPSCLLVHDLATKQVFNTQIEAWHLSPTGLTSLGVLVATNPPRLVTWSDLLSGARDKAAPDAYGVLGTGGDVKVFEDGFVVLEQFRGFVHFYRK